MPQMKQLSWDQCLAGPYRQSYGFFSSHVRIWELDHKEGWEPKNWCFWTVALEKTLESSLDSKIKPVNSKVNQHWIFIGRTDAEAEAPVLWPPDANSWLTGETLMLVKTKQEEKGMTEDEIVGWHHWLNGPEFDQTPGDRQGQGSLACYSPWGHTVLGDWATEQNNSKRYLMIKKISLIYTVGPTVETSFINQEKISINWICYTFHMTALAKIYL